MLLCLLKRKKVALVLAVGFLASSEVLAYPRVRLVSDAKDETYRRFIPALDPEQVPDWIVSLKDNPDIIFYTDAEMPPRFQDWDAQSQGIYSTSRDTGSSNNGNREFPWADPAGTQFMSSKNFFTVKFFLLPKDLPVLWWRQPISSPNTSNNGLADSRPGSVHWLFPVGTVFAELLLTVDVVDGKRIGYPFEYRLRRRHRDGWEVERLSPFNSPGDLAAHIKDLWSDWQQQPDLLAMVDHLEKPRTGKLEYLEDERHPQRAIKVTAVKDTLPNLTAEHTRALLQTPFKSSFGAVWRSLGDIDGYGPTSKQNFHIAPKNYLSHFISADGDCMTCHRDTLKHQRDFDRGREWYGRIRGGDGIISWYPFEPTNTGSDFSFRKKFVDAGMLVHKDKWRQSRK